MSNNTDLQNSLKELGLALHRFADAFASVIVEVGTMLYKEGIVDERMQLTDKGRKMLEQHNAEPSHK